MSRSLTRALVARFTDSWRAAFSGGKVIERELGQLPPTPVFESWVEAAYTDVEERTGAMKAALAESEALISELEAADAIVLGTPMYNFGPPAQLKAYFDQIIRPDRTFSLDFSSVYPYRARLASKPCVVLYAASDPDVFPGRSLAHMNFLEPYLKLLWGFIGITNLTFVHMVAEESDDAKERAMANAFVEVDAVVRALGAREAVQRSRRSHGGQDDAAGVPANCPLA